MLSFDSIYIFFTKASLLPTALDSPDKVSSLQALNVRLVLGGEPFRPSETTPFPVLPRT